MPLFWPKKILVTDLPINLEGHEASVRTKPTIWRSIEGELLNEQKHAWNINETTPNK